MKHKRNQYGVLDRFWVSLVAIVLGVPLLYAGYIFVVVLLFGRPPQ